MSGQRRPAATARTGFPSTAAAAVAAVATAAAAALLFSLPAHAGPVLDRVKASGTVRVCSRSDYYGIAWRNPRNDQLQGLDIDLAAEFAKTLGVTLRYVESASGKVIEDLVADRCDVAMHAVFITPERQQALKLSQPYLKSDIYGVTTLTNRAVRRWDDIDKPGLKVAVLAGTHIELVMQAKLKQAQVVSVRPPMTREQELESGRVDVFMTDFAYSRRLLDHVDWARLVAPPQPFHPLLSAYMVKPGDADWLRQLENFVALIKRDGRLEAAAKRHGMTEIALLK